MPQDVNFDNLSDEQLNALFESAMSVPNPIAHPASSLSAHPASSLSAPNSHNPTTLRPSSSYNELDLNTEIQQLRKENNVLRTQLEHEVSTSKSSSTLKLSPAEIEAEFNSYKQNYTAYKNKQATDEYYAQRNKQRELSGYVDPFFSRPTVAFTNVIPFGNARCSLTNSRSSFSSIHVMGGGRSNVAIGLIGVYGSSR